MPRKKQTLSNTHPYHLTARCINKEWFSIPIDEVWKIMEEQLFLLHHGFGFHIHAFVLMNNHFHLMVSTPNKNLSEGMNYFMGQSSRIIAKEANRINQVYGARFHSSLIQSHLYYLHAYKYIYRNPVEAGLTTDVCAYPYSTLPGILGIHTIFIPICYDEVLFSNVSETLSWLNTKPCENAKQSIARALKKSTFAIAKDMKSGLPSQLEYKRY